MKRTKARRAFKQKLWNRGGPAVRWRHRLTLRRLKRRIPRPDRNYFPHRGFPFARSNFGREAAGFPFAGLCR
jgi:hypothetical protein